MNTINILSILKSLNFNNNDTAYTNTYDEIANEEFEKLSKSLTVIVSIGIAATVWCIVTVIGNMLVIIAFIIDKSLRSYSNYYILNLSIADFLIGIIAIPYIPFLLNNYKWYLGNMLFQIEQFHGSIHSYFFFFR